MGRISSAVEFPEDCRLHIHRESVRRFWESHNYHRRSPGPSRSPSYSRSPPNDVYNRYRRSSPDYSSYPRRSPRPDETLQSNGRNRKGYDDGKKPFLDRDYKNRRHGESESDEELKCLGFEEYRRLKRQKLRKLLRNCIWNSTRSPPRDPNQYFDLEPEDEITRKADVKFECYDFLKGFSSSDFFYCLKVG